MQDKVAASWVLVLGRQGQLVVMMCR